MTGPAQQSKPTSVNQERVSLKEGQQARFRAIQLDVSRHPIEPDFDMKNYTTELGEVTIVYYHVKDKMTILRPNPTDGSNDKLFSVHLVEGQRSGYATQRTVDSYLKALEKAISK